MTTANKILSAINSQLGVKALFVADISQSAYGTFGEHTPSYAVVGIDTKPDVYRYPRAHFKDTVIIDEQGLPISVCFYSPERFLRMIMSSTCDAFEIMHSPVYFCEGIYDSLLRKTLEHYFNPSLLWDSVTGVLLGLTRSKKGKRSEDNVAVSATSAVRVIRLYMLRAMLTDGIKPESLRINEYLDKTGIGKPSHEKVRRVWEWVVVDGAYDSDLHEELSFGNLCIENPVPNVAKLQRNQPDFPNQANAILYAFMDAL